MHTVETMYFLLHSRVQYVTCRGYSEISIGALIIAFMWEEDDHLSCRLRYKAPSYWSQWEQNLTHLPSRHQETTYVWTEKAVTCELQCQCLRITKSWLADSRSYNFNGVCGGLHAADWLIWLNWLTYSYCSKGNKSARLASENDDIPWHLKTFARKRVKHLLSEIQKNSHYKIQTL